MTRISNLIFADTAYLGASHWVYRKAPGWYEVYRNGPTHSMRVATYHYSNNDSYALARAITECKRRDGVAP